MAMLLRTTYLMLLGVVLIAGLYWPLRISHRASTAAAPAEIRVNAPAAAQPIGVPFEVTTELTRFTPGGTLTAWGGYVLQLAYDTGKVQVNSAALGAACSASGWALVQTYPTVVTGCAFQASTSIGILERITFECIADGAVQLHLVTLTEGGPEGTTVFDTNGLNVNTDLIDGGEVTCGAPTPTITLTPTSTATITPTATASATPTATTTSTVPSVLCTTNVGGPPTLGIDVDCDTDPRFGGIWGDGCADSEDADPADPWRQIYSVPVPALVAAPTALRDSFVTGRDAQAIFRYFVAGAVTGSPVYEQDLNGNGVKDGWEYDRSITAAGDLGPPDGTIGARDAQAAFAQFVRNVRCSSGYNMAKPLCTTNVGGPPTLGLERDCDLNFAFPGVLGDGCADSEDSDPGDPWGQIYSVPVPSLLASSTALRDNVVTARDAQAVFAYFVAGASTGSPAYEQDLNQNGVKDGWEYDRRPLGVGVLGPPDGAVTAQEAQAAFKQYVLGVRCSSGYNMKN